MDGMNIRLDRSQGIDPIPMWSDIRNDEHIFYVDGVRYAFTGQLPFTTIEVRWPNSLGKMSRHPQKCVDKALILKHKDKGRVMDIRTAEIVRG